jgi:hypothetical protein
VDLVLSLGIAFGLMPQAAREQRVDYMQCYEANATAVCQRNWGISVSNRQ